MAEKKVAGFSPKYGEWAFLLGIALALIVGILSPQLGINKPYVLGVLGVLGLIVGFMNVSEKETMAFLVAAIALLAIPNILPPLTAVLLLVPQFGAMLVAWLAEFFAALGVFVAPAALIVALKQIYDLASK